MYGILLCVYKSQAGDVECLVQGFSSCNQIMVRHEHDCPLLDLTSTIFATSRDLGSTYNEQCLFSMYVMPDAALDKQIQWRT